MIDYAYEYLFNKDICEKQWTINVSGIGDLTNADLDVDSISLQESLCSDNDLIYGKCECAVLSFMVHDVAPALINKELNVSIVLDGHTSDPFSVGTYYVVKDEPTLDKSVRKITAYDVLGNILNTDYSEWYKALNLPMTLKQFRNSFFTHIGLTQETVDLVNDDLVVERTIDPDKLSGKDILQAICEINARFGHVNRSNVFCYIKLKTGVERGLYPQNTLYPSNDLYPRAVSEETINLHEYMSCEYQDYLTAKITKLQIRQEENDIGAIVGTGDNVYIIQGNFLVYGVDADTLSAIATAVYNEIKDVEYYPIKLNKTGNLCCEVGDPIVIVTQDKRLFTYILSRDFDGLQVMNDSYITKGSEKRSVQLNSINYDIIQLRGKANILERTIEQTQSTIVDVAAGLSSRITQNAESITAEVTRATEEEGNLSSRITQNATAITAKVDAEHTGSFSWELISTGFKLKSGTKTVFDCDSSGITIDGKITAREGFIGNGSSGFTIDNTSIHNGTNSMSSTSNGIYVGTDGINLAGKFKVTNAGEMTAREGYIGSGTSGFTIGDTKLYNGKVTLDSVSDGVYIGTDGIAVGSYGAFVVTKSGTITFGVAAQSATVNVYGEINFKSNTGSIKQGGSARIDLKSASNEFPSAYGYEFSSSKGIRMSDGAFYIYSGWELLYGGFTGTTKQLLYYNSTSGNFIVGGAVGVRIGGSGTKIGFFNTTPIAKATVANATYTASTTAKTVGDDLNALKTALRNYGLIG